MDSWLTDRVKELFFQPCLEISAHVGRRLDNRLVMGESIGETSLTEDLVDRFDSASPENAWGTTLAQLRDLQIHVNTSVRRSRREHVTGADIGFVISRSVYSNAGSKAKYAALVQCKKVDAEGYVGDFFHSVAGTKKHQSDLLTEITPSSFYFVFVPPRLVSERVYHTFEPLAFASAAAGCSTPLWNLGCFEPKHAVHN